jgi:peptide/nickel transport system ATP-binding protein
MPMTTPLLAIDGLSLAIAGATVVDGLSLTVTAGEVVALVGESGCGKSLTALAVINLLPPAVAHVAGEVRLAGREIMGLSEKEMSKLRGRAVSIIFQEPTASLDPLMTVGRQIIEALTAHHAVTQTEARKRAQDMLVAVGIPDPEKRLDQYPFEFSGGMCQRIMIAIALINRPGLLVADEPTTALDVTIQAQILTLMKRLVKGQGTGVLLITHDMGVVADIADRVVVMYAGRVAEEAPVHALFAAPRHPYTRLLLASAPGKDQQPKATLVTIDGTVPRPADFGPGCRFAGRCPEAYARCRIETPPLMTLAHGHATACWRLSDSGVEAA